MSRESTALDATNVATTLPRGSEQASQAAIIAAARMLGYKAHAVRPSLDEGGRWRSSIQGDVGFPDLVLAHPAAGVIFVELKRKPNRVEPAQEEWGARLTAAGAEWRVVWVPEGQGDFVAELVRRSRS